MFRFRLKSIQNYRQYIYKNAQISLAAAQQQYQLLFSRREELKEEISEQNRIWKEKQACGIKASEHFHYMDYCQSLQQDLIVLDARLKDISDDIDRAREVLLEKKKEVQILDSLEEDAKRDYQNVLARKEQNCLDELVIIADYYSKKG